MSRVAFDHERGSWVDLSGVRNDINLKPEDDDYFYVNEGRGIVLKCFREWRKWNDPLGDIFALNGKKVAEIPPYFHPEFRGNKDLYKSRVGWVQESGEVFTNFVIYCPTLQDFRISLNMDEMKYTRPSFGVR